MTRIYKIFVITLFFLHHLAFAGEVSSPYLKVLNKDAKIDRMPLLLTTVDAHISGLIVEVKVKQIYKNNGDIPLEAQYVFPGSRQAAVHEVTMKIGDRRLSAEIQEKKQARVTYQKAKSEGKTTTLLEQTDPGLFTMMVANILPDDEIEVELIYTEKLIPENGKYIFTYPAIGIPSVLSNKKVHSRVKNDAAMGFDMVIKLDSPIAIDDIRSINHKTEIDYMSDYQAQVFLDLDETLNFKEDFIIEYSLLGQQINSGVLAYDDVDNDEGYFLMMMEPPKNIDQQDVVLKEYIFVMDSSGSMEGSPLIMAQEVAKTLLSELKPDELFNVVLFAGGSELMSEYSMSPTPENIQNAIDMIDVSSAGGSTNLLNAIEKVQKIPLTDGYSRSLLVLTDGVITFTNETFDLIQQNNHKQNVFAIGVSKYNNDIPAVNRIAQAGNGQEFIVTSEEQLEEVQSGFLNYIRFPLLTDIEVDVLGFQTVDLQPSALPDLFSQRPLFLVGKYDLSNKGSIEIRAKGGQNKYGQIFDLSRTQQNSKNKAIKYLWAKEKVMALGDGYLSKNRESDQAKIKEITNLGLSHHLLTDYTSFVAVDDQVATHKKATKVGNLAPMASAETDVEEYDSITVTSSNVRSFGYGYIDSFRKELAHKKLPEFIKSQTIGALDFPVKNVVFEKRPSITFILGEDETVDNQYYSSAEQFFRNSQKYKTDQVITHLSSISDVKDYLKKIEGLPWGVINIVTHSSLWSGLSGRMNNDDSDFDVFALSQSINDQDFRPLSDNAIDAYTEIRLLGCSLGKHQQLLNATSIYFGGRDINRPIIKSPQDFVYFGSNDEHIKTFKSGFALIHPSLKNRDKKIIKKVQNKNPFLTVKSLDGWQQRPVTISTQVKNHKGVMSISAIDVAKRQKNISAYLKEMGAKLSDFKWSINRDDNIMTIVGETLIMKQDIGEINPDDLAILDLQDVSTTTIIGNKIN